MLRIELSKKAAKFLRRLPPKQAKQIARKLVALRQDPRPHDAKKLKGIQEETLRADVGEYRIIYRVAGDTLQVPLIGKRNDADVYRRLRRR